MTKNLEKTAVIRKDQTTNFAQKARISNNMRKDANNKAYLFLKRTDPLVYLNEQPSKLNGFNPTNEINLNNEYEKPVSPNRLVFSKKKPKKSGKEKKEKSESNQLHNELEANQYIKVASQNRIKPKYSLYKRNNE